MGTIEDRFWAKVEKRGPSDCWPWLNATTKFGYGQFVVGDGERLAHRYSYKLHNGAIPPGAHIRHSCDNPPCVNPAHLKPGTHLQNMRDMVERERSSLGERNGMARLTPNEVLRIYAAGKRGELQDVIALRHGLYQADVGRILRGERWASVTGGKNVTLPSRRAKAERSGNGKLTLDQRAEIIRAYSAGEATQTELGARYAVSQVTISRTIRGTTSHN